MAYLLISFGNSDKQHQTFSSIDNGRQKHQMLIEVDGAAKITCVRYTMGLDLYRDPHPSDVFEADIRVLDTEH